MPPPHYRAGSSTCPSKLISSLPLPPLPLPPPPPSPSPPLLTSWSMLSGLQWCSSRHCSSTYLRMPWLRLWNGPSLVAWREGEGRGGGGVSHTQQACTCTQFPEVAHHAAPCLPPRLDSPRSCCAAPPARSPGRRPCTAVPAALCPQPTCEEQCPLLC